MKKIKANMYIAKTTFEGANSPSEFYFDTKEKATEFLKSRNNGEIIPVIITATEPLNYTDGCTYNELIFYTDVTPEIKEI